MSLKTRKLPLLELTADKHGKDVPANAEPVSIARKQRMQTHCDSVFDRMDGPILGRIEDTPRPGGLIPLVVKSRLHSKPLNER